MKVVIDRSGAVARWTASRIPLMAGTLGFEHNAVSFGVLSDAGEPLGGVVFTDWQPAYRSIQISFASASPRWLTPRLVTTILLYPFGQLSCSRITSLTPSRAASALRFLQSFGFVREGLIRRGFGTDDAIISGLLAEEWAGHRFNRPPFRPEACGAGPPDRDNGPPEDRRRAGIVREKPLLLGDPR